ncbi:MAG: oligosaccharide flippase family protein [Pseudomonadota bacterium]
MSPIRSMLISGAARASTTLIAVVRTKIVAVLLGPEGIGLLGLLTSLQEAGAQTADGGMSHSGVRQLARARNTPARLARIRLAMAAAILCLAVTAAVSIWMLRIPLSELVTGTKDHATSFGILGVGIAALMIFRWQQTLLCGFQRVASHSGLTTIAAALGAVVGIGAILLWHQDGIVWAVLMPPAVGILLAPLFTWGLPQTATLPTWQDLRLAAAHGRTLFRLGISLLLSALAVLLTPMILRIFLARDAGLDQVGFYQAGLVITLHLTGLIMAAVSMDYYPRLSAVAGSARQLAALMNAQARLHLAFGGPLAILIAATAPFLLQVLFSPAFTVAAALVQWMMLGAVLRLAAVPAEMILMATAQTGTILRLQLAHQCLVLAGALVFWPMAGLAGLGLAYCLGQAAHLAMLSLWNWRTAGIAWRYQSPKAMLCSPVGLDRQR